MRQVDVIAPLDDDFDNDDDGGGGGDVSLITHQGGSQQIIIIRPDQANSMNYKIGSHYVFSSLIVQCFEFFFSQKTHQLERTY